MRTPIAWVAACLVGGAAASLSGGGVTAQSLEGARPAKSLAPAESAIDDVQEALLPYGERTPYEPLKKSLDDLFEEGWDLDQASGTLDGFTILMRNGNRRALCVLVPRDLGQDDEALVDCRQLN